MSTQPTDDEIIALADATRTAEGGANGYILPVSFARAVLAKWGTPTAGEPAVSRDAVLDLIDECPGLTMEQDHWLSRRVKELEPTSPQPVREPLTPEQIESAAPEYCVDDLLDFKAGVVFAERHHGIKGGQHAE